MISVIGDDNPFGSARVSLSIIAKWIGNWLRYRRSARVAELADALDLGSSAFGCGGSNPPSRTSGNCQGLAQVGATLFSFSDRIMHRRFPLVYIRRRQYHG